ncbi:hypothetical protein [Pseudomonas sp. RIT-PI-o]|uniref:hypothetical protein n=1 Tax=Pseudomonas sp. RIT-PI-o TaxID=1690246 RepID=UPI0006CCAB63|nr:hypothetical protein [Pseudomonas sp. RIT-PI-o]KPG82244.1 hypothetical protein AEQ63_13670 [Pseudomonas sp. RIT-PI-o]
MSKSAKNDENFVLIIIGAAFSVLMILGAIGGLGNHFLNGGHDGWLSTLSWLAFGLGGSGVAAFSSSYVLSLEPVENNVRGLQRTCQDNRIRAEKS